MHGETRQIQHLFSTYVQFQDNSVMINENTELRTFQDPRKPSLHPFYNMFIYIQPHNTVLMTAN